MDNSDRVNIIYAGFWSRLEISPQITSFVLNVSGVLKIIVITLLGDGLTTLLRETEIKFKYLRKPPFLRRGRLRRRFIFKDEAVLIDSVKTECLDMNSSNPENLFRPSKTHHLKN